MGMLGSIVDVVIGLGLMYIGAAHAALTSLFTPRDAGLHPGLSLRERCLMGAVGTFMRHGNRHQKRLVFQLSTKLQTWATLQEFKDASIQPVDNTPGVPCYSLQLKSQSKNGSKNLIILYFHGGAMVQGEARMWSRGMVLLLRALRDMGVAARILSVEYHLAPEYPFPTAVDQARVVTEWLLEQTRAGAGSGAPLPRNTPIVLMGDSAGANLVLTTLLQLSGAASIPAADGTTTTTTTTTTGAAAAASSGPPAPTRAAAGAFSSKPAGKQQFAAALLVCPWVDLSSDAQAYTAYVQQQKGHHSSENRSATAQHVYPCTGTGTSVPAASAAAVAAPLAGDSTTAHSSAGPGSMYHSTAASKDGVCTCVAAQSVRGKRDYVDPKFLIKATNDYLLGNSSDALPSAAALPASPLQRHPLVSPGLASDAQLAAACSLLGHGVHVWVGNDEVLQPDITRFTDRLQHILGPSSPSSNPAGGSSNTQHTTASPNMRVQAQPHISVHAHPGGLHNYPLLPGKHQSQHTQHIAGILRDVTTAWYGAAN